MLFGCVLFLFSEVVGSFWLDSSCLSILGVSDIVLLSCSLFVFWCISIISRSENQPFFIIVLIWSVSRPKTSAFLPDFNHSFFISS